ncbi:MAG: hypothetical protein NTW25_00600 [Candidatus Kapabacteria bacterium]|nr:hypothetical protein [Candidatus Kapabacteria bacterium]
MVQIKKEENNFVFEVIGLHKLWAFKSQLVIPKEHIVNVRSHCEEENSWWKGWKLLGTSITSFLTAGSFYKDGDKIFWDVVNINNSIVIELSDENFKKLIVEVEDTHTALSIFK